MSIDKDLSGRLMEGRSPGDLFGKEGMHAMTRAAGYRKQTCQQASCCFCCGSPRPSAPRLR
ncbi:hypothetical protein ETW24_05190 [Leisingera sp. NJS204]|nr:hypothetical protein ETW24_05190 [Leisingera sp. NJS204]